MEALIACSHTISLLNEAAKKTKKKKEKGGVLFVTAVVVETLYFNIEAGVKLGLSLLAALYQRQCTITEPSSVLRERGQSTLAVTLTVACDCASLSPG